MRRLIPLLFVALLMAQLAACGDDDGAVTTTATTEGTTSVTTTEAPTTTEEATTTPAEEATTTTQEATTTTTEETTTSEAPVVPFELTSASFEAEGDIPVEFTCDGANISPALDWGGNPAGTESLALLMDDPDAGDEAWVHWVIFNIPPTATSLPEAVPAGADAEVLPDGTVQGINDFGVRDIADFNHIGWDGPCPGPNPHRYVFRLFALDALLELAPGATLEQVEGAIEGHVIAETTLIGLYPSTN